MSALVKFLKQKFFHSLQVRDSQEPKATLNVCKSLRIGHQDKNNIKSQSFGNKIYLKQRVLRKGSTIEEKPFSTINVMSSIYFMT